MAADSETPQGVGMTAVGVAYLRALETSRPDRLFADPLAAEFVKASGWTPPDGTENHLADVSDEIKSFWGTIAQSAIVRTRFLDDFMMAASDAGLRQFVILGAGLDARAFRLDWPPRVRLFELYVDEVIAFKERVLDSVEAIPLVERIVVRSDLRGDWLSDLTAVGFDASQPTGWIAEGLLIYLTADENETLLTTISDASAKGSRLAMTLGGRGSLDVPGGASNAIVEDDAPLSSYASVNAMWKSEAPDDPAAWLAHHGWKAEVFSARERAATYGRPLPESAPESATRSLVSAVRAQR
jgi:methyltransferase (TIGR00027 family)